MMPDKINDDDPGEIISNPGEPLRWVAKKRYALCTEKFCNECQKNHMVYLTIRDRVMYESTDIAPDDFPLFKYKLFAWFACAIYNTWHNDNITYTKVEVFVK